MKLLQAWLNMFNSFSLKFNLALRILCLLKFLHLIIGRPESKELQKRSFERIFFQINALVASKNKRCLIAPILRNSNQS